MDPCPPPATLEALLSGDLPAPAAVAAEAHVSACSPCQERLRLLCDDSGLRQWLPPVGIPPEPPAAEPGLARLLHDLRDTPRPERAPPGPLTFLAPPRREGDLGCLGPYPLEAELGRGGMGIVFRGRDEGLGRTVAVKVLRPELDTGPARARFVREAQAMARVRHDHVVGVYAVADPAGAQPYFLMEYLAGPSLAGRLQPGRPLDPREAAALAAQMADGLAAAHAAGLVHRDIKPSNVLLDPDTGRAKIADFGLARLTTVPNDLTQEGVLVGTPAYMSPEQARGEEPDARADVYGLGAALYEMLTGATPFRGAPHMVLRQVLDEEPRPPRRLNDAVPRDLETVCLKAMAREPARRYPTARDLADDLRRFLKGEPIHARRAGRAERAWRWCRRNPRVALLSAALAAVFLAGFAGVAWQWQRADLQRRRAEVGFAEADRNFRQARAAVDRLYDRVYENGLLGQPGSEALRRQVLQDLLGYYRDFLEQRRDDPALRAELAETCFRVGRLTQDLGARDDALAAYRQALPLYEELAQAEPGAVGPRHRAAVCHDAIGQLLTATGHRDEARRACEQARDGMRRLVEGHPEDRALRLHLAAVLGNLANVQPTKAEAVAAYREALALQEQLLRDEPDNSVYQSNVALTCNNLALAEDDTADALRLNRRALELRQRYLRANPSFPWARHDLARTCQNLGLLQARLGKLDEACRLLRQACDLLDAATRDQPDAPRFQDGRAQAYLNLGKLQAEAGDRAAALRATEQAVAILEHFARADPADVRFHNLLVLARINCGCAQEALGRRDDALRSWEAVRPVLEGLIRDHPGEAHYRNDLAENRANVGNLLWRMGRHADALPVLEEACAVRERLAHDRPDNPAWWDALGQVRRQRGEALVGLGRAADAVPVFRAAVEAGRNAVGRAPRSAEYRRALGGHYDALAGALRDLGRRADAEAVALEGQRLAAGDPGRR